MTNSPAVYPTSLATFTVKTNKVDLVNDDHVNYLQNEVVALQTYIGTNPHGSQGALATRLNVVLDGTGVLRGSTGYPDGAVVQSYPRQLWYRTDLDTLYVRNQANTQWLSLGGSLSNVIYVGNGSLYPTYSSTVFGYVQSTTFQAVAAGTIPYLYWMAAGVVATMFDFSWRKPTGVNTLRYFAYQWVQGGGLSSVELHCGGLWSSMAYNGSTAPTLNNSTLDVSSLTVGTNYILVGQLRGPGGGGNYSYATKVVILGE